MPTGIRNRYGLLAVVVIGVVLSMSSAFGAGAYSHFYIGRRSAEALIADPNAPAELREALKDPACLDMFSSGAVSPDLGSLDKLGHYDKTTVVPKLMIETAEGHLSAANSLPTDDPKKLAKIKAARKELAFSYGWLSHCAADLNVHPKVNEVVGDAFIHCDIGKKAVHAAQEVQLDYYVNETLREEGEKINYDIPYAFVALCTGKPEAALRVNAVVLRTKMVGETLAINNIVDVGMNVLENRWGKTIRDSLSDTSKFVKNPKEFKDWDLDVGRMTTEEFEGLRDAFIKENGGKLPEHWGRRYFDWWNKVKGLSGDKLKEAIRKLLANQDAPIGDAPTNPPPVKTAKTRTLTIQASSICMNMNLFVNGKDLLPGSSVVIDIDDGRPINLRAMVYDNRREVCLTEKFPPGEKVEILARTPHVYHYKLYKATYTWEPTWRVTKEVYKWRLPDGISPGRVYSSGVYVAVENDALEFTVPTAEQQRDLMKAGAGTFNISVNGDINWLRTAVGSTSDWPESGSGLCSFLVRMSGE